jgi:choice-of-anchor B domain-containing protein
MRTTKLLFASALLIFTSASSFSQRCIDGFSGVYPCHMTDQLSMFPLELFETQNANDIWGWTNPETGREFVTLGLFDRTAFIDITTPQHPLYIGYLPTATFGSLWRDMKVRDGYAYIVAEAGGHGMQVFDLRRLESVSYIETPVLFSPDAWYTNFGNAHNIAIDEVSGFAYPIGSNTFSGGLHIVNINNPTMPVYAGSSDEDGYTHDAQVVVYNGPDAAYQGKQICFAANENSITIFDVTDKQDVEMISRTEYDLIGYTHQCWLTEDHRYLLSTDELDEINFDMNTRSIIWDVQDLTNPEVIGYVDLENTSIDHNVYVKDNMLYFANYTSGLRIFDVNDIESGLLNQFGYFDVFPNGDPKQFSGSWSNYPYFESEVIAVTSMYSGVHFVKPRYAELENHIIKICGSGSGNTFPFDFNQPIDETVFYNSVMPGFSGIIPFVSNTISQGAPFSNSLFLAGLSNAASGYFPGYITISHGSEQRLLKFVVAKNTDDTPAPVPVFPVGGTTLESQSVQFEYSDALPGYARLQVATDPDFDNIVFEKEHFNTSTSIPAIVPFDETMYFWRLIKPNSCGDDIISETGFFVVGTVSSVSDSRSEPTLRISPNPASDLAYISGIGMNSETIELFDIAGRKLFSWNIARGTDVFTADISAFPAGIYIMREARSDAPGVKLIKY